MGCTSSIRGSRAGYCRDQTDDSNSPIASSPKTSRHSPTDQPNQSGNLPSENSDSDELNENDEQVSNLYH